MNVTARSAELSLEKNAILGALRALRRGDFETGLPENFVGVDGEVASVFNDAVAQNRALERELARLRTAVGREGRISERGTLNNASGGSGECIDSVNALITDTVQHTT